MSEAIIKFPILGSDFRINPSTYFTIGNFRIYWYGVIIAVGFLLAVIYAMRTCKKFGYHTDTVLDAVIIGVPSGVIGARLYYVANNFDAFRASTWQKTLLNIVNIKNGGSAIYGGLLLVVIGIWLYCRKTKTSFFALMDMASPAIALGSAIGRWGNFINRELYGKTTRFILRMGLDNGKKTVYVHPTFLYESVWNLAGFLMLHFFARKRKFDGQMFGIYVVWYGVGRVFCEYLRDDSQSIFIGNTDIKASMVFGIVSILAALVFLWLYGANKIGSKLYVTQKEEAAAAALAEEVPEEEPAADNDFVVLEEGVDEDGNRYQYVEIEVEEDEETAPESDPDGK